MHAYTYAYEKIRDQILSGEIEPHIKLTEEMLAEKFGISRTPIRSAIAKLEQEGMIRNKRIFIPTANDIRHIFQVRILIEGYAANYCSKFISEDALNRLKKCVEVGFDGTLEEVMEANHEFHQIIIQETRNPLMISIIDKMQSIIYLFRKTVVGQKRPHLIDEHANIYKAIENHDDQLAQQLMVEHLEKDLEFSLSRINN
ncbi:GntR family transcriptional regulator [Ureibacillus manganicus DSM 26584]|uniref:GntR family transcriptional regulator n=2 Tax=Ureibacillus TaxID=160795 RepID=A0A0A3IRS0_9BACL|nr:GntR family transcriptional regulator [Ureibacillus manganicus DSM 26584]